MLLTKQRRAAGRKCSSCRNKWSQKVTSK